jgi:RHS repeat-associated protein
MPRRRAWTVSRWSSFSVPSCSASTSLVTNDTGGFVARVLYYPYGEERYHEGTLTTDYAYTGQRKEGFGLYDYQARFYDPSLGRFVSADTIVPGAASGAGGGLGTISYSDQTRLTPLTVGFHKTQFLQVLNAENGELLEFGQPALWDGQTRQEHNVPAGPANPQALNRYAYCLNNPLVYTDPTGHVTRQQLTYFAAKLTTQAEEARRNGETARVWTMIGVGIPVGVGVAAACGGTFGWGCGLAVAGGVIVDVAAGELAYQLGGGAKAADFTDIANFINETLAVPEYADIESFEVVFLPPLNGEQRSDYSFYLRGYRADGTVVDIHSGLSVPAGMVSEAEELLRETF